VQVLKRNGATEEFSHEKIANALYKVWKEIDKQVSYENCLEHAEELTEYYQGLESPLDIESIQDDVEMYLMHIQEYQAAKAYIEYRKQKAYERDYPWKDMDDRQELVLRKYTKHNESKKDFLQRISIGKTTLEKIFRRREALWGGRILYAVGRDGNITGSNCYVATDPEDSLEDIYRADYDIAKTYSYGGGQGMNISKIRPRGAEVNNASNTSPGPMVFAEKFSHTTLNTQQENRRGALMLIMNIDHPDIINFATSKLDLEKINGANISVALGDEFMQAVESDENWELRFETYHEIITKKVKARELLDVISYSAHTVGDPGIVFIDNMNNYHMLSEYDEVNFTATNPCGEQPLMANGSCNLSSINLSAFVRNPFEDNAYFDYNRFEDVVKEMTLGLDDMLDILGDRHALEPQRKHVTDWREIGLGVMGLADFALKMKNAYGSKEFLKNIDSIMREMINISAQTSALRAKEKEPFPKFDADKILTSSFSNVFTKRTRDMIKEYGLRNSRLLSIAPTGSISNVLGISGGVEPFYRLGYNREIKSVDMVSDETKIITVFEKTPKELAKHMNVDHVDDLPEWAKVNAGNLDFNDRAKVQSTIQAYVDTAISSTFNLSNDTGVKDITDIYLTAWRHSLKGATVFRDNCAKIGILTGKDKDKDRNPGTPPTITLEESWLNKKTGETKEYVNILEISMSGAKSNKIEKERCPVCGDILVKQSGCTKCRNPECVYEKCAI